MEKETKSKRKILKWILLVLLIIVIIFIVLTIRKIIIISNLQNKINMYTESTNYYAKLSSYQGTSWTIIECYVKDDTYILYLTNTTKEGTRKFINYSDGTKTNTYIETNEDKIAILNSNGLPSKIMIADYTSTNNFGDLLFMSIMSSIRSDKCNGKNCYYIDGLFSSNMLIPLGNNGVYIEKETGLPLRCYNGTATNSDGETFDCIVDYKYEINVVTDEDITEPDITEYRVEENS